jgi:hypothetical protein
VKEVVEKRREKCFCLGLKEDAQGSWKKFAIEAASRTYQKDEDGIIYGDLIIESDSCWVVIPVSQMADFFVKKQLARAINEISGWQYKYNKYNPKELAQKLRDVLGVENIHTKDIKADKFVGKTECPNLDDAVYKHVKKEIEDSFKGAKLIFDVDRNNWATISFPSVEYDAVEAAIRIIAGGKYPKRLHLSSLVINAKCNPEPKM